MKCGGLNLSALHVRHQCLPGLRRQSFLHIFRDAAIVSSVGLLQILADPRFDSGHLWERVLDGFSASAERSEAYTKADIVHILLRADI